MAQNDLTPICQTLELRLLQAIEHVYGGIVNPQHLSVRVSDNQIASVVVCVFRTRDFIIDVRMPRDVMLQGSVERAMDYAMEHMLRSAGTIMFHGFYKDVLLQRGWHKECSQYTDGLYTQIKEVDFDLCPPRQVEDKTIVQVRLKDGVKVTSTIGEVKEDPAHLFGYLLMLDK